MPDWSKYGKRENWIEHAARAITSILHSTSYGPIRYRAIDVIDRLDEIGALREPIEEGDWFTLARVLVGESVYEDACISASNGMLWIEFKSDDLNTIGIPLDGRFKSLYRESKTQPVPRKS